MGIAEPVVAPHSVIPDGCVQVVAAYAATANDETNTRLIPSFFIARFLVRSMVQMPIDTDWFRNVRASHAQWS